MVRSGSFSETLGFLGKNYPPAYETGAEALGCEGFRKRLGSNPFQGSFPRRWWRMNKGPSENRVTYFARTDFRDHRKIFGIRQAARQAHMYLIGKPGTGTSTLL